MKALVTGSTGFTGSAVVPILLDRGVEVFCLARSTSDRSALADPRINWIVGDVADVDGLQSALQDKDALINIVSLGFGHAEGIVRAAENAGIKRAIFISTTAIFTQLNASSKAVRMAAEATVTGSALDYTILRPTMIYGSSRDRNMCRLIRLIDRFPLIPIFGNGQYLQQPIYVHDLATAIVDCLGCSETIGKDYNLAGATPLTYNAVIDTVAEHLNRRVMKLHLPAAPVISVLSLLESIKLRLPIKAEQIMRLNEDKAFGYETAAHDFGFAPRTFAEGIALEIADIRKAGRG